MATTLVSGGGVRPGGLGSMKDAPGNFGMPYNVFLSPSSSTSLRTMSESMRLSTQVMQRLVVGWYRRASVPTLHHDKRRGRASALQ